MAVARRTRKKNRKTIVFYQAEVFLEGTRIATQCFDTKAEAYLWHDREKERLKNGLVMPEGHDWNLRETIDRFFEERVSRMGESTRQAIAIRRKYLYGDSLAAIKMKHLRPEHLDRWVNWLFSLPTAKSELRNGVLNMK